MELENVQGRPDAVLNPKDLGFNEIPQVHQTKKQTNGSSDDSSSKDLKLWTIPVPGSKSTVLRFQCSALAEQPAQPPGAQLHMTFKTCQAETKLLAAILNAHGMAEVDMEIDDFNLLWTGVHPKPQTLRAMTPFQRVNHFPRSYELTRKDRLSKNIEKMQHAKGGRYFDFIPQTFVIPVDYRELCAAHYRNRGPWIVKPVASSRGRGIYIVNSPDEIQLEETMVVAKYIDNPLLVDGHKCDLRLYVAVTSYDPLVVYVYEEGLVRFAAVKYDAAGKHLWNPCMHLCNYSVNKYHSDYIKSDDPQADDVGHKWTLSAFLRHLRSEGMDTATLMLQIEELVVKSILAAAPPIISACNMFVQHPQNCFELYGFDILVDSTLKPWLLEVNLSPSLGCDTPLDMRVKSALLTDLLTMVGLPVIDPVLRKKEMRRPKGTTAEFLTKLACRRVQSADSLAGVRKINNKPSRLVNSALSLTTEESRLVRNARAEFDRRGGFVRVFPSAESWQRYGGYLDRATGVTRTAVHLGLGCTPQLIAHNYNLLLHQQLFPELKSSPRHRSLQNLPHPERLVRYEKPLLTGHTASLEKINTGAVTQTTQTISDYKCEITQCLDDGSRLSQWQARRLFGQYLNCVLRRITAKTSQEGEGHGEVIIRFLHKASTHLRSPYNVQIPSAKLEGKDRDAVIAKQLCDFIYMYSRETDMYTVSDDKPQFVPRRLFHSFCTSASEDDLEEVLSLHTRLYKCSHIYLGHSGPSTLVSSSRPMSLLQTLPSASSLRRKTSNQHCDCTPQPTRPESAVTASPKRLSHKVSRAL